MAESRLWPADIAGPENAGKPAPDIGVPDRSTRQKREGYRRDPAVSEIEISGQKFLANSRSGMITWLNETASAVWHVLAAPTSADEIVDLMTIAFPDVERVALAADVRSVLDELVASGHLAGPEGGLSADLPQK